MKGKDPGLLGNLLAGLCCQFKGNYFPKWI